MEIDVLPDRSLPAFEAKGVRVRVDGRNLIDDIDWRVDHGQHWVVLGANGAGKTTLLSIAAAVRHPTRGEAWVLGHRLGRVDLRALRRHIGLVAVGRRLVDEELMEDLDATAHTVVLTGFTGTSLPLWERYGDAERSRALDLLGELGCKELAGRPFSVCSQGERARIRIARALAADPALLLLDEPFAGLDLPAREGLIDALEGLDVTSVLVTHHPEETPSTTTHALLIRDGRISATGPAADVLTDGPLTECFGLPLRSTRIDGRWSVRADRRRA